MRVTEGGEGGGVRGGGRLRQLRLGWAGLRVAVAF